MVWVQAKIKKYKGWSSLKGTSPLILRFTDSDIYYQKFNEFSDVNFYRESLFQILPTSNFDMHDQLLREDLSYFLPLNKVYNWKRPSDQELEGKFPFSKVCARIKLENKLCTILKLFSSMSNPNHIFEDCSRLQIQEMEHLRFKLQKIFPLSWSSNSTRQGATIEKKIKSIRMTISKFIMLRLIAIWTFHPTKTNTSTLIGQFN